MKTVVVIYAYKNTDMPNIYSNSISTNRTWTKKY